MGAGSKGFGELPSNRPSLDEAAHAVPYRASTFWDHSYAFGRSDALTDRDTMGPFISVLDARFHFNAVENSILRALARAEPIPPRGALVKAWEHANRSRGARLLDVGSGSGHWIDFFLGIGVVSAAVGCDISPRAVSHLQSRFAEDPRVQIVSQDIAEGPPEGPFDYVNAIGVMFHIVEDERWRSALSNLATATRPGGLLFMGGEFGHTTRNVQFYADEDRPLRDVKPEDGVYRVCKRVRSLADWQSAAAAAGVVIADLIRTDGDPALVVPENDVLVLRKPG